MSRDLENVRFVFSLKNFMEAVGNGNDARIESPARSRTFREQARDVSYFATRLRAIGTRLTKTRDLSVQSDIMVHGHRPPKDLVVTDDYVKCFPHCGDDHTNHADTLGSAVVFLPFDSHGTFSALEDAGRDECQNDEHLRAYAKHRKMNRKPARQLR